MPAIRITHIHDLFDAAGRELDIVEMGHLDQRIHDGATARPIVSAHGDLYDQPDPELLVDIPLDPQAALGGAHQLGARTPLASFALPRKTTQPVRQRPARKVGTMPPTGDKKWKQRAYITYSLVLAAATVAVTAVYFDRLRKDDAWVAFVAVTAVVLGTVVGGVLRDRDLKPTAAVVVNSATAFAMLPVIAVLMHTVTGDGYAWGWLVAPALLGLVFVGWPFAVHYWADEDAAVTRAVAERDDAKAAQEAAEQELIRMQGQSASSIDVAPKTPTTFRDVRRVVAAWLTRS